MHRQVVNTGCGDDDFFLVGAAALYGQRKLGWRAATLASSTELIYIFFAVDSMCLLPASGLLSPAFAPARRAHPATGRPVLSPLSPGAARHRGGRRAVEAGVLEHLLAEGLRAVQTALPGQKFRRLRRAESDRGGRWMALSAPSCVAFLPSLGVLFRGTVRAVRSKMVEIFLLQKWIDLDELNPMVWVPSIVRRRIDFSLAVFELGAPRALHPYMADSHLGLV
jgi:hypothetical protein